MNTNEIKKILQNVTIENLTGGTMGELWERLPDYVAGSSWAGEVVDLAERMADWLSDDEEIDEDKLTSNAYQIANGEIEDYYSNINKRVQELSLWAYPALDNYVEELGFKPSTMLTDLNSNYLYAAMLQVLEALVSYTVAEIEKVAA